MNKREELQKAIEEFQKYLIESVNELLQKIPIIKSWIEEENMKEETCQICGEVLRFEWTDLHGEANCINCQVPYQIYHYDDKNKPIEKPPEININEKYIPAIKKYWEEFGKRLGLGHFLGVNPNMQNRVEFEEWLDNNRDLILEEKSTEQK